MALKGTEMALKGTEMDWKALKGTSLHLQYMCTDFFTAKYNEIFFSENSFNFVFTLYKMHFQLICQTQI